jgi:hypothetical protein
MAQEAGVIFAKNIDSKFAPAGLSKSGLAPSLADLNSLLFDEQVRGVATQVRREFLESPEMQAQNLKVQKVFKEVKTLLLKKVELFAQDPIKKAKIIAKLKAIHYKGMDCTSIDSEVESISGLFVADAKYDDKGNNFKFCAAFGFNNHSEFRIAYTITHELAHAFDPCGITLGPKEFQMKYKSDGDNLGMEKEFPFPGILECLRGSDSVGALQELGKFKEVKIAYPDGREVIQRQAYVDFCEGDQIGEAFADYMAEEVIPDYLESKVLSSEQMRWGYSNIWRGQCADHEGDHFKEDGKVYLDPHPAQRRRVNYGILVQPKIRRQMGCTGQVEGHRHCEIGPISGDGTPSPQLPSSSTKGVKQ